MHRDTIVAPATPPGEGGVAIIRLSGPHAEAALEKVFHPHSATFPLSTHHLCLGDFFSADRQKIDEVLAVVMRAPRSYTGDDVVEIHCHGSRLVVRQILDTFIRHQVRLADPGEFTLRAFTNGKLDLSQAEAVIDLIQANSERAGRVALSQMEGELSRAIHDLREPLLQQLSLLEAYIDFPEEDLPDDDELIILQPLRSVLQRLDELCASFDQGRILREGLAVLILGRPNVGKSSLRNTLVGEARAIVTDVPGTTRDLLEERISLGGVDLRLIDTAGIRSSSDPVEREGVRRAREKIALADLVLLLVDGSCPLGDEDLDLLKLCDDKTALIVRTKADLGLLPLPSELDHHTCLSISAHEGSGLTELEGAMLEHCLGDVAAHGESLVICDRRHLAALIDTANALRRFFEAWGSVSLDLLALELREALDALGRVTGETTPDEVLNAIFSRFCIGK